LHVFNLIAIFLLLCCYGQFEFYDSKNSNSIHMKEIKKEIKVEYVYICTKIILCLGNVIFYLSFFICIAHLIILYGYDVIFLG